MVSPSPSLFPGTRLFLLVTAVAGKDNSFVSPCKGERARLQVGGSHASLPFQDGVTRTVGIRTHHQPFGWSPALEKGGYDGRMVVIRTVPLPFSPGLGYSSSSQPSQGRTNPCVPLKGGKGPLQRVGGSYTSLPFQDGVTRRVGIRTHHQPFGWSPALEKGGYDGRMVVIRTVPLPFSPGLGCSFSSQPSQGRTIALCPPERGKGPASAGRGFAHLSTFSRRCYSGATRMVSVRTYPPSIRTVPLPFQGRTNPYPPRCSKRTCPRWRTGSLLGLGVMAALWLLFILLLQWHG